MKKPFYQNLSLALILAILFSFSTPFSVVAKETTTKNTADQTTITDSNYAETEIKDTTKTETAISEDKKETNTKDALDKDIKTKQTSTKKTSDKLNNDKKSNSKTSTKKIASKQTNTKKTPAKKVAAKKTTTKKYTNEEITMVQYVVQNEAGSMSSYHKQIIADVILNRVFSKRFPNSVKSVLSQRGQFSTWKYYLIKRNPPSKSTKEAVLSVMNGDKKGVAKGALFFYAPTITRSSSTKSWFERQTFVMQLSEKHYGTTYTHRFFK